MSSSLAIEPLSLDDVSANVALSRSVGWKDVASEWHVLHAAARVLGVRGPEALLAQGALGDCGSAASLAKMVVAPEAQGQGLGRRLLEELLIEAEIKRIPVGLCATEQGRPLYEKVGFHQSGEIMILVGTPTPGTAGPGSVVAVTDAAHVIALERRFIAADRSRMLRARFAEANAAFSSAAPDAAGFVLATGAELGSTLGPLFAHTEDEAKALALATFAATPGPVRIDVPVQHVSFRQWLVGLGLREMSLRVEMARGAEHVPWQVPERFALATQAWC